MKSGGKQHGVPRTSLYTSPVGFVSLLLVLATLIGSCEASQSTSFLYLPLVIFFVIALLMCIVFWVCVCCCVWISKSQAEAVRTNRGISTTYTTRQTVANQYVHSQTHYPTSGLQPYPQQTYHYPQSGYPTPAPPQATFSESVQPPVSLPEATLHQGDAPPAYEEAVRMKTVDVENDHNT